MIQDVLYTGSKTIGGTMTNEEIFNEALAQGKKLGHSFGPLKSIPGLTVSATTFCKKRGCGCMIAVSHDEHEKLRVTGSGIEKKCDNYKYIEAHDYERGISMKGIKKRYKRT